MSARSPRDPAATRRIGVAVGAAVVLWPLFSVAEFDPFSLLGGNNAAVMGAFLARFLPPKLDPAFLSLVARAAVETLAIATAGMTLALAIGAPLGLLLSRSLAASEVGPGPGRGLDRFLRGMVRVLLTGLRGIPELVWALVLVRVFGLGPASAVLALGLTYGGMLAKVYAEILDSAADTPARALLGAGAGRLEAFLFGLLPDCAQELASYTIYRWECAVRASIVMGFVGAGGLGQLMDQSMKMLNGEEVATILAVFLLLVALADRVSAAVRRGLA